MKNRTNNCRVNAGIVTIHFGFNYGSVLQSYALTSFINHEFEDTCARVIDYIPARYAMKNRLFIKNGSFLKRIVYPFAVLPFQMLTQMKFDRFIRRNIPITSRTHNLVETNAIGKNMDLLITGSDQVWNSDYNGGIDPIYYLDFGGDGIFRLAYAASCGKSYSLDEWRQMEGLLKKIDKITLRESDALEFFQQNGFLDTELMIDPTFLLSREEWEKMAKTPRIRDYVLVYALDKKVEPLLKVAHQVARRNNLKVAVINYCHIWNRYDADYVFRNKEPAVFLGLMSGASAVVTNSFHGIAFSIIMEKNFYVVKRDKYNSRLDSVLNLFGLQDRYVEIEHPSVEAVSMIDYAQVNALKLEYQEKAKETLLKAIEVCRTKRQK